MFERFLEAKEIDAQLFSDQTLPPIHERPSVSEARSNRGRREFETEFWRKPSPPKPFVLHLGVTARSHAIAEFRQNFPELWPLASMDK